MSPSKKKGSPRPSADTGLAPENYAELNRALYHARPWTYFEHRLRNVILVAGAADRLSDILREGVRAGTIEFEWKPDPDPEVERRDQEQLAEDEERFTITEAEVLLHHASETLLRLYLAHEALPESPWLDL